MDEYKAKKELSFFQKLVSPMKPGSLRKNIILWISWSLGTLLLFYPYIISQFGIALTVILTIISMSLNWYAINTIIKASTYIGKFSYLEIVNNLLDHKLYLVFKVTLFIDMWSGLLSNLATCWNIFIYLLIQNGFRRPEWFLVD